MKIPFYKPAIGKQEIKAVVSAIKSGWITEGPKTREFEKKFAKYVGCKHAIALNSGTGALFLSLLATGIKQGDEVITTPFTFSATAMEIVHFGAKPVFADIEEETFNIDPKKIKEKITEKTKAILPVHFAGQPCQMKEITKIAKDNNLAIIEDAAHATGAEYYGKKIGSFDNLACFSFYATKNLTTGEGGMITTNNDTIAKNIKVFRTHGINKNAFERKGNPEYQIIAEGYKFNTTDINSAIGLEQLKKLDSLNKKREKIFEKYNKRLSAIDGITLPKKIPETKSSFHLYTILLNKINRNEFRQKLELKGISTSIHFSPLHLQPFFQEKFSYKKGDFPITEKISEKIVSLPNYPNMTKKETDYVCKTIKETIK